MPNVWSKKSHGKLITCHKDIQTIFNVVLRRHDCTVIWGRRGEDKQNELFDEGTSQKRYPDSKHNTSPLSEAIDIVPVVWGLGTLMGNDVDELKYFYIFAGIVKSTMLELYEKGQIKALLRWGGDWDNDLNLDDQTFNDLYHWERVDAQKYLAASGSTVVSPNIS